MSTTVTGSDGLTYTLDGTTLTITGTGTMSAIAQGVIDSTTDASTATAVIIGEGVTSVGPSAFYGMQSLTSVSFPSTLTTIGSASFFTCYGLTSLDFPANVNTFGSYSIYECINLTSIKFRSASAPSLGGYSFSNIGTATIYSYGWADSTVFTSSVASGSTFTFVTGISEVYKHLTYNGSKIQVDSAIRDDTGKKISTNYLPLSGGTLTGSLSLTGTASIVGDGITGHTAISGINSITCLNQLSSNYRISADRSSSTALPYILGVNTSPNGWLRYRSVNDFKSDIGLNDKLDKVTSEGTNRLYGISGSGTQTVFSVYDTADAWTIPRRGASGVLAVGTPTANDHATTMAFVNSSIATNTANFLGTFNIEGSGTYDLGLTITYDSTTGAVTGPSNSDIATALTSKMTSLSITPTSNDYVFVCWDYSSDPGNPDKYDRFKYTGSAWSYEYTLNNSSFTQAQWASINSGANTTNIGSIANKLDKITAPTNQTVAYISDANWGQGYLEITPLASADTIARRGTNGVLQVGTPSNNTHATTKLYVDTGLGNKLDKLEYEWNESYNAVGTTIYLKMYESNVYDSNITIDIDSTTANTYHGTLVIATQNYLISKAEVYDDPTGNVSSSIRIVPPSVNTPTIKVYFVPNLYSKNMIHMRASGVSSLGTMMVAETTEPADATVTPTNVLTTALSGKADLAGAQFTGDVKLWNNTFIGDASWIYDRHASSSQPYVATISDVGSPNGYWLRWRTLAEMMSDLGAQSTLVSGTNIKSINNSSILASGNLSLQPQHSIATVTIATTDWSSNACTKNVTGVTASNTVIVSPAPSSFADYGTAGIYCSAQGSGTLTFTATTVPTSSLTVNVAIFN